MAIERRRATGGARDPVGIASASRHRMRRLVLWVLIVCAGMLLRATPASASAEQEPVLPSRVLDTGAIQFAMPDVVTWEHRLQEVQKWIGDFQKWQEWNALWRNRREPGWIGARERKVRPDPPLWLAAECHDAIVQEGETLAQACRLLS